MKMTEDKVVEVSFKKKTSNQVVDVPKTAKNISIALGGTALLLTGAAVGLNLYRRKQES